ncbi:MAG: D-alanyl-D-alanine carboxypeptidase/D-alanyl-D-alanine-endopeptidase (penicillin-binding protein 4), partial [Gammaproteobacteria bacterium]
HVKGRVIGVGNYFDQEPLQGSTSIADAGNYYGAGANGLSYKDNAFTIYFKTAAKDGGRTQVVRTSSKVPGLKITNLVVASKNSTDNAYIYGIPGTFERVIMGELPMGKSEYGIDAALPDPALQFAYEFQTYLKESGLTFEKDAESWLESQLPYDEKLIRNLAEFASPKLQEIVNTTMKRSVNTFADAMIKHIGKKYFGSGSYENGTRALKAVWGERGVPIEGWYQKDGSGLSRANSITSQQIALVTAKVNEPFKAQLKQGMKPLDQGGRVIAKSGYMERVRSYSGYITMSDGSEKAFCIIVNNHSCTPREMKAKIVRMLERMATAS